MLLRSASTPILRSLNISPMTAREAQHEPVVSVNVSSLTRAMSENRMIHPSLSVSLEKEKKSKHLLSGFSSLMDDGGCKCKPRADSTLQVEDEGCVGDGNYNSHVGGGNSGGGSSNRRNDDSSNDSTDAYYQRVVQSNPENSLVLGNYAKFLKEVRGDVDMAQEYCERAILADQKDSDALSMYAEILWEKNKDADRAETYFDRAIQAAPNDCHVLGLYARFLWEAEDEEEQQKQSKVNVMKESIDLNPPVLFSRAAPTSIAAAS